MDENHLYARILAQGCRVAPAQEVRQLAPDAMGDCSRCGRTDCYLHTGDIPLLQHKAWLVTDEEWPEFAYYRRLNRLEDDKVVASSNHFFTNTYSRLLRRIHLWLHHPLPVAQNSRFSRIARAMCKQLDASDTHLVVPQDLLPWLQMAGELRGRQYDVFMNALPVGELQRRLDIAVALHPQIRPLNNFRADAAFLQAEAEALAAARHWITPHAGIIALGGRKAVPLAWQMPEAFPQPVCSGGSGKVFTVLLAAPSLARKGACELATALRALPKPVQLLLLPGKNEAPCMWTGVKTKRCASVAEGIREADVVVLPAWVEHQPRIALRAIASGKPLIATPACGLPAHLPWISVAAGDAKGLRNAILSVES
jgi:glycosyltransferase involved in cell wall biosynthesis